jgi:hypothetical protein
VISEEPPEDPEEPPSYMVLGCEYHAKEVRTYLVLAGGGQGRVHPTQALRNELACGLHAIIQRFAVCAQIPHRHRIVGEGEGGRRNALLGQGHELRGSEAQGTRSLIA